MSYDVVRLRLQMIILLCPDTENHRIRRSFFFHMTIYIFPIIWIIVLPIYLAHKNGNRKV